MKEVLPAVGTYRHIRCQADDQGRSDGVRDGCVGVLGFLAGGGDDVKADEGVEARGCSLQHLQRQRHLLGSGGEGGTVA